MQDALKKTDVKISKVDAGAGNELQGAELTVTRVVNIAGEEVDEVVESWTSDGTVHTVAGLTDGTYTLTEESAPNGYKVAESITFTIKDGKLVEGEDVKDGVVIMKDEQIKVNVKIILYDKKTGKTVKGVKLKLLKSDFETVDEWKTDDKEHEVKDLVLDETYTLEEEVPVGYEAADALKFKVDKDGNILKLNEDGSTTPIGEDGIFPVNIVPTEISFQINKVDAGTGEEVEGAVLTVIEKGEDGEETVLERWTSKKGETHDFGSKLERGKQYLLREVTAPVGYGKLTTDIAISVNEDGTIKTALAKTKDKDGNDVYLVENTKISVKISKVDITSGTELEGAKIRIIGEDGKVIEEWTSTKAVHEVFGLEPGVTYTLNETVAPNGYALTADTTFVLKEDGSIDTTKTTTTVKDGVLLVQDKAKISVKISKVDITSGTELEGAKIRIIGEDGKVIEEWTSTKAVHEVFGLEPGVTYILRETVAPKGYALTADTTFVLKDDGSIDTPKTTTTVKDGVLLVQDKVFSFKVRKQDEAGKLLGGAKLKISYRNNKEIVSWTTEANKEKTITGLGAGKYYLYEVQAPAGYQIAQRIEFEIDEYGTIKRDSKPVPSLIMVDKKTSTNQPQKRATVTPRPANSTNVSKKSTTGSTTTAKAKTTGAKTGDNSPIMLYIILLVAAGAVIVVIKRRSRSNK